MLICEKIGVLFTLMQINDLTILNMKSATSLSSPFYLNLSIILIHQPLGSAPHIVQIFWVEYNVGTEKQFHKCYGAISQPETGKPLH